MAFINKVKLIMDNDEVISLKEVRWVIMMNDFLEIYNMNGADALIASRFSAMIMNEFDMEFLDYERAVDFVAERFDIIEPMKDERFIDYIKNNFILGIDIKQEV